MKAWCAVVVLGAALAGMPPAQAQLSVAADRNQPQSRELRGEVANHSGAPVRDAIVYLKNTKTLVVKTYITGADGAYRFPALAPNADYQVYAERQGKRSDVKTLSSFDSRSLAYINLKIDIGK